MQALPYAGAPFVEMQGISRFFGGIAALRDVDLTIARGEVVALLGDNGAGKSTLIKILAGALGADAGEIRVDGLPVTIENPSHAKKLGIETIYQDLALCDNLDVPTNLFLGRELTRPVLGPVVRIFDRERMNEETRSVFGRLKIDMMSLRSPIRNLSGGQRQSVAIAKSVYFDAKVLVMDEPTAALGVQQTEKVLSLVGELRQAGLGIVYISHILEDVFRIADRVVVLKNGRKVGERDVVSTTRNEVVRMMITGKESEDTPAAPQGAQGV